jgi:hypothetical protein
MRSPLERLHAAHDVRCVRVRAADAQCPAVAALPPHLRAAACFLACAFALILLCCLAARSNEELGTRPFIAYVREIFEGEEEPVLRVYWCARARKAQCTRKPLLFAQKR